MAENRSMGRICILCSVFFIYLVTPCLSSEVRGLTYFLSGRDGAGHTIFDRFELYPSGQISWQTASKGGVCPGEGGMFQGHLNDAEKLKILELVNRLYESEKNGKKKSEVEEGDSNRRARHLFQVEFDDAVFSFELTQSFANSQEFFQELSFVKAKTRAQRAVRLSVSKEKNAKTSGLLVSFLNIGNDPFRMLLPKNPDEAFFLKNGGKISYRKLPHQRDILLPKGKSFELFLDISGKIQGPLYYDSGIMQHHALPRNKDFPPLMEVFLCAGESL